MYNQIHHLTNALDELVTGAGSQAQCKHTIVVLIGSDCIDHLRCVAHLKSSSIYYIARDNMIAHLIVIPTYLAVCQHKDLAHVARDQRRAEDVGQRR